MKTARVLPAALESERSRVRGRRARGGRATKQQRYRQRCIDEGRCPHCGELCAPYYECADRQRKKRLLVALKQLEREGIIVAMRRPGRKAEWEAR